MSSGLRRTFYPIFLSYPPPHSFLPSSPPTLEGILYVYYTKRGEEKKIQSFCVKLFRKVFLPYHAWKMHAPVGGGEGGGGNNSAVQHIVQYTYILYMFSMLIIKYMHDIVAVGDNK